MNRLSWLFVVSLTLCFCEQRSPNDSEGAKINYTQYVDPYIGTGFHGHVFLGANVPFGSVQLGPTNLTEGWDWCSGYHYSDTTLIGFAHTHLSGTGIGDLGDILLMPTSGEMNLNRGSLKQLDSGYVGFYHHEDEIVKPGYYSVWINRYQVRAELTTTARVGMHRYTFEKGDSANLIIDLERGIGWDGPVESHVTLVDSVTVAGYRYSKGWAVDQKIYFSMKFSEPIKSTLTNDSGALKEVSSLTARRVKAGLTFGDLTETELLVKVGISAVSIENAHKNLEEELPHWDFDQVVSEADEAWNKELSKIHVQMASEDRMKVFYTSLYHTMIAPSVFSDVNGAYRGADGKTYQDTAHDRYTTYSLWDTYRAAHPLFTLTQPEKTQSFIYNFLDIYQQQGKLPIWHLVGNETDCMIGYPAIPVIADAYFKGYDVDAELAMEAMKASATRDDYGMKYMKEKGYIPADLEKESVAKAMEYCLSDWAIAQVAKDLGKEADYQYYKDRALAYKQYFDPKTKFVRAITEKGSFREPFDPFNVTHMHGDYTEGNAWQYTWLVPHDVEGLIDLFGSEQAFEEKLDSLFIAKGYLGDEASPDVSGLIGQYAHGNEPSHHITYLYNYLGKPWKTAEKVRYIMDSLYTTRPDGLCGNEDVGQMSAWYVLSALGFYQVNPSNGQFVFGSPLMDEATVDLGKGKRLRIRVKNNSPQNKYISKIHFDGVPHTKSYISYAELAKGGELLIEMDRTPSNVWGVDLENRPVSSILTKKVKR